MLAIVLSDNIADGDFQGEWGLSIYIEYNGKNFLLDTGASNLFVQNANKLGKSIKAVDYAILSHAHYDHSDSMATFFNLNNHAPFFLRKDCKENCYSKKRIFHKYIGLPKHILTDFHGRITYVEEDYEIIPGVYLIPHKTPNLKLIGKRVCTAGNIINGYMTIFHMNRVLFFEQKRDWSSLTAAVMAA